MTILRALCFLGLHVRRGWEFVGSSWVPDAYVRVCIECGQEVNPPSSDRLNRRGKK